VAKLAERFGREVRTRRKARALTQAQLAEATHLSEEWIRRIERGVGAPSFDAIEALSAALSVSVQDLFASVPALDHKTAKIDALLAGLGEAELTWVEGFIQAALRYPKN
jgi:transcriptional regulator with XRE-family HTH domain